LGLKNPRDRVAGRLAVYVTSHGFGHLNRTAAVLNQVPADVPVTIRSHSNLFEHWRERLKRPAEFEHYVCDVGAVNPQGDSNATDPVATIKLAMRFHGEAMATVDDQARRLREQGTAAVLCDAPAVPLVAARRAGVPGFLMSNFTWADIYAPYARAAGGEAPRFVAELRACYRQATATFRVEPAMSMAWLSPKIEPGMAANQGRDRSNELRRMFGLTKSDKLVYIYIGRYGQNDLDWSRLGRFSAQGVHFLGYLPEPHGKPDNFHFVPSAEWPGGDLIASSDAIVAKAGYGTVCEAMASGTPMIYPPRTGFAEYRSLDRALRAWGGGVPVSSRNFFSLELNHALSRALAIRLGPAPYPADGARKVADHLVKMCRPVQGRKGSVVAS
jgi:UDP:flavonoid glycosyltransferase YjiC (YdhE family)